MNTRRAWTFCAALGCFALASAAPAKPPAPPPPPARIIDAAVRTLGSLHAHLGRGYGLLLNQAKAVLIAPAGAAGDGVLLLRWGQQWSDPAFFDASALPGKTATVLLLMSDHALDELLRQRGLDLDGPDALSMAPLGSRTPAELVLWPGKARLDPDGFTQDDTANASWYGRPRNAAEIVGGSAADPRSLQLRRALGETD